MPLVEPEAPEYGPSTFTALASALATLYANDEYLKGLIDNIDPTPAMDVSAVTPASGYSNHSSYTSLSVVRVGTLATLDTGVLNCPASFGTTYYTAGTVAAGFRPVGAHRMAPGGIFTSSGIVPCQVRINTNGGINFLAPVAVSGASYLLLPSLSWRTA